MPVIPTGPFARRFERAFYGRASELEQFTNNLALPPDADERRMVYSISGPLGVGKTSLLIRMAQIAQRRGALVCAVNSEDASDPLEVMTALATMLEQQGCDMSGFTAALDPHVRQREALEANLAALRVPAGSAGSARAATQVLPDLKLLLPDDPRRRGREAELAVRGERYTRLRRDFAKETDTSEKFKLEMQVKEEDEAIKQLNQELDVFEPPDAAVLQSLLTDLAPLESLGTSLAGFIAEATRSLTPVLLENLRRASGDRLVTLFFDTYEQMASFLDPWLPDLLRGEYGAPPLNLVVATAGRISLSVADWIEFEQVDLLQRLPLRPFTEEEARTYIRRREIADEQRVSAILNLSGRLPLYIAVLTISDPVSSRLPDDPDQAVIEQFLSGLREQNAAQHRLALRAALPRRLDRELLTFLAEDDKPDTLIEWFLELPFVRESGTGLLYNPFVRQQLLGYWQRHDAAGWRQQHSRLTGYFDRCSADLGLETPAQPKNPSWQAYVVEAIYHRICTSPREVIPEALGGFLDALEAERGFALRWAAAQLQAEEHVALPEPQRWGKQLSAALKAYEEDRFAEIITPLTELCERTDIADPQRAVAFAWRGEARHLLNQMEPALADLNHALELRPDYAWALGSRGQVYLQLDRPTEALADLNHALELRPDYAWALGSRGQVYLQLDRPTAALSDFQRAIELGPEHLYRAMRGAALVEMKRFDDALRDYNRALELKPDDPGFLMLRGGLHWLQARNDQALADLTKAAQPPSDYRASILTTRGLVNIFTSRYEEALEDLNQALTIQPGSFYALSLRGSVNKLLGQYEEALRDLDLAFASADRQAQAMILAERWAILASAGDLPRALAAAEALRNEAHTYIAAFHQSLVAAPGLVEQSKRLIRQMIVTEATYPELVRNIAERVLSLTQTDPDAAVQALRAQIAVYQGYVHDHQGHAVEALVAVNHAIELDPIGLYYALRGEISLKAGRNEAALADMSRACELQPDSAHFLGRRGDIHRQLGQYEEALADYTRLLKIQPESIPTLTARGTLYFQRGRYADAVADITRVIETGSASALGLLLRGEAYQQLGQTDAAIADLDRAIALDPDSAPPLVSRGGVYLNLGRPAEALADLDRALDLQPDLAMALSNRGAVYLNLGQHAEALADLDRALDLQPDLAMALSNRGAVYLNLGQPAEALADLNRALDLQPDLAMALSNRGAVYLNLGQHADALADLDRALALDPERPMALLNRGAIYLKLGRSAEALADLDRALALQPEMPMALINRGGVLASLGRHDAALADLNRVIELQPDLVQAVALRGAVYATIGQTQRALDDYNAVVAREPERPDVLENRADLLRELQRYDEALADYNAVVAREPERPDVLENRADLLRELERYDEALADYSHVLTLQPDRAWSWALRGETYRLIRQHDEALCDLDRAIAIRPDFVSALGSRGQLLAALKRYDAAYADLNRALELRPDYQWARTGRADVHFATGRYTEALADLDTLLAEAPSAHLEAWRGLALANLGRLAEAAESYRQAQAEQPENLFHAYLAAANQALKEGAAAAEKELQDLARRLEDGAAPSDAEGLYISASLAQLAGDHDQARGLLRQAIAADPDQADTAWVDPVWRELRDEIANMVSSSL